MLPPGHVAAGFLTTYAVIKLINPSLNPGQINGLLMLGAIAGFAPDLDFFYAFYRVKSLTIQNNSINHRTFISHTPVVWLVLGLLIYFFGPTLFWKLSGIIIWLGAWSHLALDSIQHGVMWLWPLSKKRYALRRPGMLHKGISEPNFFKFWWKFLATYPKELPYTFISEVLVISFAIYIFINNFLTTK